MTRRLPLLVALAAALLGALAVVVLVPSASASSTGPCAIELGGVNAASEPARVDVPADGQLTYHIVSPVSVVRWVVAVHYGPLRIPVLDEAYPNDGALERSGPASVNEITKYGTGLYTVTGDATMADGTHCFATMQLAIHGSPLASVIGLVAVGLLGVGAAGVLAIAVRTIFDVNDVRAAIGDVVSEARGARSEADAAVAGESAPGEQTPPSAKR